MSTGGGVDQLGGDAHAPACLAHQAYERVADAQIATDLFLVSRLALMCERRITGDDKEPADPRECRDASSTMQSAKYSFSGSPLISATGNTAIDWLSGSPKEGRAVTIASLTRSAQMR